MSDEELDFIDDSDAAEVVVEDGSAQHNDEITLEEMEVMEVADDSAPLPPDDSILCFNQHNGSVFSVSVSPGGELVCTGGEDDRALVWKLTTGEILFECQGHKDSVCSTGFSGDGKYLATADMGGLVQVWTALDGKRVWSFETGDLEWMQWHCGAHVLLVGTASGEGWMWRIPSGDCKTFQGHNSRNTCGTILNNGKVACFAYEDGAVKVWDLKEVTSLVSVTRPQGHSRAVTCMAAHPDGNLLLTGSADSTAKLTNINSGKVVATFPAGFPSPKEGSDQPSSEEEDEAVVVEAVGFSPVLPVAVTGSLSGVLGVWDLPTQQLRLKCPHQDGVVRVHCSRTSPLATTASLDGVVREWDLRTGQCGRQWQGHSDHILDMVLTQDEKTIITSSDDQTCRIFSN